MLGQWDLGIPQLQEFAGGDGKTLPQNFIRCLEGRLLLLLVSGFDFKEMKTEF